MRSWKQSWPHTSRTWRRPRGNLWFTTKKAALSSVDYEDYVRNESEIKEKMASIKKELKVMKISEQITDKTLKHNSLTGPTAAATSSSSDVQWRTGAMVTTSRRVRASIMGLCPDRRT